MPRLRLAGFAVALSILGLAVAERWWTTRIDAASTPAGEVEEVPPTVLLAAAIHRPLPEYPMSAIEGSVSGVTVVFVSLEPNGAVHSAQLLEAPDRRVGEAAVSAARAWRFEPPHPLGISAERVGGRLIFYFAIDAGSATVRIPTLPRLDRTATSVGRPSESK